MNARYALALLATLPVPIGTRLAADATEALEVLDRLVEVADRAQRGEVGAWRSALSAALDGDPPPYAATNACGSTTIPCGFASCEVHYGPGGWRST